MSTTYQIIRFHFQGERKVIETGLTLEDAQAHCSDDETNSKTCSDETSTANPGEWFDGYEKE